MRRIDPENRKNQPFLPQEALSLHHALEAFTVGSAHVNHDDDAGVISVGRRADLAVLDRNLFEEQYASQARVMTTTARGRVVFER